MPAFSAALFKNERKDNDRQPDFTGIGDITKEDFMAIADAVTSGAFNATEDGKIKLRVAGWRRESRNGKSYISLQLSIDDYKPKQSSGSEPIKVVLTEDLF